MWTNLEHCRSSSTPAQPTYFSTPVPTVRKNILNVQADGRLAAHLRETPASHVLEEDAEPNEDLNGGERGQERARKAKEKIENPPQD